MYIHQIVQRVFRNSGEKYNRKKCNSLERKKTFLKEIFPGKYPPQSGVKNITFFNKKKTSFRCCPSNFTCVALHHSLLPAIKNIIPT